MLVTESGASMRAVDEPSPKRLKLSESAEASKSNSPEPAPLEQRANLTDLPADVIANIAAHAGELHEGSRPLHALYYTSKTFQALEPVKAGVIADLAWRGHACDADQFHKLLDRTARIGSERAFLTTTKALLKTVDMLSAAEMNDGAHHTWETVYRWEPRTRTPERAVATLSALTEHLPEHYVQELREKVDRDAQALGPEYLAAHCLRRTQHILASAEIALPDLSQLLELSDHLAHDPHAAGRVLSEVAACLSKLSMKRLEEDRSLDQAVYAQLVAKVDRLPPDVQHTVFPNLIDAALSVGSLAGTIEAFERSVVSCEFHAPTPLLLNRLSRALNESPHFFEGRDFGVLHAQLVRIHRSTFKDVTDGSHLVSFMHIAESLPEGFSKAEFLRYVKDARSHTMDFTLYDHTEAVESIVMALFDAIPRLPVADRNEAWHAVADQAYLPDVRSCIEFSTGIKNLRSFPFTERRAALERTFEALHTLPSDEIYDAIALIHRYPSDIHPEDKEYVEKHLNKAVMNSSLPTYNGKAYSRLELVSEAAEYDSESGSESE